MIWYGMLVILPLGLVVDLAVMHDGGLLPESLGTVHEASSSAAEAVWETDYGSGPCA